MIFLKFLLMTLFVDEMNRGRQREERRVEMIMPLRQRHLVWNFQGEQRDQQGAAYSSLVSYTRTCPVCCSTLPLCTLTRSFISVTLYSSLC